MPLGAEDNNSGVVTWLTARTISLGLHSSVDLYELHLVSYNKVSLASKLMLERKEHEVPNELCLNYLLTQSMLNL
jgi:hypothetical protein